MRAQTASGAAAAALGPLSGSAIVLLSALAILLAILLFVKRPKGGPARPPPGPTPWPILGSMHYLGMYDIPFEGFTHLKKFYGDVFALRMGSAPCVVLNTPELRDEAIVAKANDFDGRPNFVRFAHLFGGRSCNCKSPALRRRRPCSALNGARSFQLWRFATTREPTRSGGPSSATTPCRTRTPTAGRG